MTKICYDRLPEQTRLILYMLDIAEDNWMDLVPQAQKTLLLEIRERLLTTSSELSKLILEMEQ
jgi:hypothetical protein